MTDSETLLELAQEVAWLAQDQDNFAGNAAQYAKDGNLKMFREVIDRSIQTAESLPHRLRDLKRFVEAHPELDRGGF